MYLFIICSPVTLTPGRSLVGFTPFSSSSSSGFSWSFLFSLLMILSLHFNVKLRGIYETVHYYCVSEVGASARCGSVVLQLSFSFHSYLPVVQIAPSPLVMTTGLTCHPSGSVPSSPLQNMLPFILGTSSNTTKSSVSSVIFFH